MTPARTEREGAAIGIAAILATTSLMALGDALVKRIGTDIGVWQIYVLRSLIALPLTLALIALTARRLETIPKHPGWILLRSAALMAMWVAFYAALPVLSLPVIAAAYYTGPLFITALASPLSGEPVGPRGWAAVLIGFLGVLVILGPGTDAFNWAALLPVLAAFFYALAAIITRTKCRGESPLVLSLALNLSFLVVGIVMSAALALSAGAPETMSIPRFLARPWAATELSQWLVIAGLAGLAVAIGAGVAKAYQSGPPQVIAAFDYAYLVFACLWSWAFFSVAPEPMTILGMVLIAGAGLLSLRATQARIRPAI